MDAHFDEYLAAVAGMQDVYGEPADGGPNDFHDDTAPPSEQDADVEVGMVGHWEV